MIKSKEWIPIYEPNDIYKVIEELKNKIDALELKIDALIQENTELHKQVAKMEERLLQNARKKSARTQNRKSNG